MTGKPHIVVVGGGVIGLSIAISLLDSSEPCNVSLLSHELPDSNAKYSAEYASAWAGAHHVSAPANDREVQWDLATFETLVKLEAQGRSSWLRGGRNTKPLVWVRQLELFANPAVTKTELQGQKILSTYPRYVQCKTENTFPAQDSWNEVFSRAPELPWRSAHSFDTLDIDVTVYLPALAQRFKDLGGHFVRCNEKLTSLSTCLDKVKNTMPWEWTKASGLFVATGLGTRHFSELSFDANNLFPVRGQTVLVNAPWMHMSTAPSKVPALSRTNENGERDLYLIPRAQGRVIVGGTRLPNDADPSPREDTTRAILSRAVRMCPSLVPPQKRELRGNQSLEQHVDILSVNVGLRPARKGGPLLERSERVEQQLIQSAETDVKVVLAYGFGGYGYQNSWGAAFEARSIMRQALGLPHLKEDASSLHSLAVSQVHL